MDAGNLWSASDRARTLAENIPYSIGYAEVLYRQHTCTIGGFGIPIWNSLEEVTAVGVFRQAFHFFFEDVKLIEQTFIGCQIITDHPAVPIVNIFCNFKLDRQKHDVFSATDQSLLIFFNSEMQKLTGISGECKLARLFMDVGKNHIILPDKINFPSGCNQRYTHQGISKSIVIVGSTDR